MANAVTQIRQLVAMVASRRSDDRRDASAVQELRVEPDTLGLPPGMEVRWLGVAGYLLRYEQTTVLIDPYVTRCGVRDAFGRAPVRAASDTIDHFVPRADAILVGHTHFDHALDVPAIARRDHATVYGSTSLRTLMGLHGMADQAVTVAPHRRFEIGPFEVTFVPSTHSKFALGRVPMAGEITCEHLDELTPRAFRCGQVWGIEIRVGGATLYHQGSADLLDDELTARSVDVFLCGIAGRHATPDYFERVLPRLDPRTLVIGHHDDFLRPLGSDTDFTFGVAVHRVPDEVAAVSADVQVVTLPSPTPIRAAQ